MSDSPIEDYLDDLLRSLRADARTTRRVVDEAADHLYATAAALCTDGVPQRDAEAEAVRRFGPVAPIARSSHRHSMVSLALETLRAAFFLAGWGLAAVGASGLVALVMNLLAGHKFVGAETVLSGANASVDETANDAVVLRVLAGVVGLVVLLAYSAWRKGADKRLLPPGLVDSLGAAAFAAGSVVLTFGCIDQATLTGTDGVGFALSGLAISLPATAYFCARAVRGLLHSQSQVRLPEQG